MLLLRVGYVKHLKGHHNYQKQANYANLLYRPADNTYVVCNIGLQILIWIWWYTGELQDMYIQSTQIKDIKFICHICLIPMKSNAVSRVILYVMDTKTRWKPSQVMQKMRGGLIYIKCGNHHVCVFMLCCFNAIKILLKFYCH